MKTGELTAAITTVENVPVSVSPAPDQTTISVSLALAMATSISITLHAYATEAGPDAAVTSGLANATSSVSDASAPPNGTALSVPRTPPCQPRTACASVFPDGLATAVMSRSTTVIHHVKPVLRTAKVVLMSANRAMMDTTLATALVATATHVTVVASTATAQLMPVPSATKDSTWPIMTSVLLVIHVAVHAMDQMR